MQEKLEKYMYAMANIGIWSVKNFSAEILTIFSLLYWKIDTSYIHSDFN